MEIDNKQYSTAMAHLESGCIANGIASVNFRDGEVVMISLEMLQTLVKQVQDNNQTRALIFISTGPDLKENLA
jgi:hypothetical protein